MTANRLRDFAVYIAIGLCVGLLCVWFAERDIDKKWLSLTFETCLAFGYTIGTLKRLWRLPVFWIGTVVLSVAHLTAFGLALRGMGEWRATTVGLTSVVEIGALVTLLELLSHRVRINKRRSKTDSAPSIPQKR